MFNTKLSRLKIYFHLLLLKLIVISCNETESTRTEQSIIQLDISKVQQGVINPTLKDIILLDTALYNQRLFALANNKPSGGWPVKTQYPLAGAILPFKRMIAYYGNLYSAGMGILGALPKDKMFIKLHIKVKRWEKADSTTPFKPALHYIAVTAQRSPGPYVWLLIINLLRQGLKYK